MRKKKKIRKEIRQTSKTEKGERDGKGKTRKKEGKGRK